MKKNILISVLIAAVFAAPVSATTYCDIAGDTLAAWNVQAEYKEKYFEYNTFYNNGTVTTDIMLRGMDQDFVVRLGLPDGYFVSLGANYVFQNLEALYDLNNIQTITLLAGKYTDAGLGLLAGIRYPLGAEIAPDKRLINKNDMYDIIAGFYAKAAWGAVKFSFQGVLDQPIRMTDYLGQLDLSASAGFNFYDDPNKQVIDILTEVNYTLVQRGSGDAYSLTVIPQAVVKFYDDFSFVLGVEILAGADNMTLNKQEKLLYVVKANYVMNSSRRAAAAAILQMTPVQSGFTAVPVQTVTSTGGASGVSVTPEAK